MVKVSFSINVTHIVKMQELKNTILINFAMGGGEEQEQTDQNTYPRNKKNAIKEVAD
jgi:hypothetical protein